MIVFKCNGVDSLDNPGFEVVIIESCKQIFFEIYTYK